MRAVIASFLLLLFCNISMGQEADYDIARVRGVLVQKSIILGEIGSNAINQKRIRKLIIFQVLTHERELLCVTPLRGEIGRIIRAADNNVRISLRGYHDCFRYEINFYAYVLNGYYPIAIVPTRVELN